MTDILPFLKQLISMPGLSGYETPIREHIQAAWQPLADEVSVSRLGSLHALKRGSGPEPRHSLLIATHMDAIGLMVTGVTEGFLHLTEVGGLDPRVLPGQIVTVHGRRDLPGLVVQPPAHLLPADNRSGPVQLENLLVDTGLEPGEVARLVRPGDLVSFAQPAIEMGSEILAGHSLDNRASVAALTQCLAELQGRHLEWDIWAVATAQEEVTLGGAYTSAFQIRPDVAVVMDVTWASSPGSPNHKTYPMGKGPTLGYGPNIHPALHKAFKDLAERLEIPHKVEVMALHSGSDAIATQVTAEGIPSMVMYIPLRYMHTPVEVISVKDITRAARLVAEFAASLDEQFMDQLAWKD
jgi:endoglucanase